MNSSELNLWNMSLGICNIHIILPGFVNATNLGYRALMPSNKIYWLKYLPRIFLIRISDLSWTCAHSVLRISGMGKSRLLACSPQLKFSTQAGPCLIPPRPNCPMSTTTSQSVPSPNVVTPKAWLGKPIDYFIATGRPNEEQAHFKTFWIGHGIISI